MGRRGLLHARSAGLLAVVAVIAGLFVAPPPARAAGDPAETYQWALDVIGAKEARRVGTGAGITIAVVDTGVDLGHEDLAAKLVPGANLVNPGTPPQDDNGRGTHVAGIGAAMTGNDRGIAGVAPDASIAPVKAFDANAQTSSTRLADGIRWAAEHGAEVIDVSLDGDIPVSATILGGAIQYAWDRGSLVVISAGNPALMAASFANRPAVVVAATTRSDAHPTAYNSSVGNAQWALSAPGGAGGSNEDDDILSTYWPHQETSNLQTRDYGRYRYLAGTPMAAAHVAGAAAVLRGLGLSPEATVQRLLSTARDVGDTGRDTTFGAGVLDLAKAVRGLRPRAAPASTTTTSTTVAGASTTAAPPVPFSSASIPRTTAKGSASTSATVTGAPPSSAGPSTSPVLVASGRLPTRGSASPLGVLVGITVLVAGALTAGWWWRRVQAGRSIPED